MKNVIKNTKFLLIATAVIIFVIVSTILLTGAAKKTNEAKKVLISKNMIPHLLISQEELPWNVVLYNLDIGSEKRKLMPFVDGKEGYYIGWSLIRFNKKGAISSVPEGSINISVALADSPKEAVNIAERQSKSYSMVINEVVGDKIISKYTDRAWGVSSKNMKPDLGANLIYTRGPFIVDLHMSNKEPFNPSQFISLLSCMSRKIDAALAGKPEPIPIMPLTYHSLNTDKMGAWKMRSIGTYLWGKDSKNIALYDVNGVPRSLPAKQLSSGDYLVPFRHVGAILGPNSILERHCDEPEIKTTLMKKSIIFYQNKSEIYVDGKKVKLSRPIEFKGGLAMVPLTSLVQKALGKKISWSQRGSAMIGKVH
jgi:hypothetical protein